MHESAFFHELLSLLLFSVLSVALFRRLNLPSVLGYLVVGMLAGPHALGLIEDSHIMEQIAEIGVVFLLFMIGLEISIPRLMGMRRIVFGIGSIQVLLSTASTVALGLFLGMDWKVSLVMGGAMAMSSTAIAIKQLAEQHELHSRHGNVALGVLLFQDLAVVPFLVLIPILAAPDQGSLWMPILMALGKGALAFVVIYLAGEYVVRPATHWIAGRYSPELFTLFILLVALAAAVLTFEMGLSLAMGAFLAGMMLAETQYEHQIQIEIRPFRDVLMGLFFIIVGAQFNFHILVESPGTVAIFTLGLILGKGLAIAVITRLFGYENGISARAGISLAQGSEFGFALLGLSISVGLVSIEVSQPVIAAIVFSMAVSPMLIRYNGVLAKRLFPDYLQHRHEQESQIEEAGQEANKHVLVCGFGRTAQNLCKMLERADIPFIALEVDPILVQEGWDAGYPVYYGDGSHSEVLRHAGLERARAVVITFHDQLEAAHILNNVRKVRSDVPVIARTIDAQGLPELLQKGANDVVPDTVESSLMLAWHTLVHLDVDRDEASKMMADLRANHYAELRAYFHGQDDQGMADGEDYYLHSIEVADHCQCVGKSIEQFAFAEQLRVVALIRQHQRMEPPDHSLPLLAGDVILVEGLRHEVDAAEDEVLSGL